MPIFNLVPHCLCHCLEQVKLTVYSTPLGQAIGIATHTLYSPNSKIGLLVVGIMNAISAGFLVFASLVELMSEDFLSDASWQTLRGKERFIACLLVFFGAFLMSLVVAWARAAAFRNMRNVLCLKIEIENLITGTNQSWKRTPLPIF